MCSADGTGGILFNVSGLRAGERGTGVQIIQWGRRVRFERVKYSAESRLQNTHSKDGKTISRKTQKIWYPI